MDQFAIQTNKLNFGPRLERFAYRRLENDSTINILEGSVRSGKTWALHPKIIQGCSYPVSGWRLITGVSKQTIFNNVLNDLFNLLGPKHYSYNHQSGMLRIGKTYWLVIGGQDEGSEKYIRGLTAGIVVGDEITKLPKSFFQMLLSRMSPVGSRFYGTTNTDSPNHWLKTDYLDNRQLRPGAFWSMHCTMDDNPNLSPTFVANQKTLYRGLFYKRLILGLWVLAEGSIYGDYWWEGIEYGEDSRPVGLYGAGGTVDRAIWIDYGTTNPMVFLDALDDGDIVWVDREWYWDSKVEQRQLTDSEYAHALIKFIDSGPVQGSRPRVVVDPSAASFKLECERRGLWVVDADNDVDLGIKRVAGVLGARKVRIHRRCKNTLRDMPNYAWDDKAKERGEEIPKKIMDHAPDAFRYGTMNMFPSYRLG